MFKRLKELLVPFLLMIVLLAFLLIKKNEQVKIIQTGNFTEGIVFDVQSGGKNGLFNYYSYQIGGTNYVDKFKFRGYSIREIGGKKYQELIGSKFKIFYDESNPEKNILM